MFRNISPITKNLILLNIIFFLAKLVMQQSGIDLDDWLAAYYPLSDNFKSYQIISYMFMHGGFMHILFNMFGLYMFGSAVEQALGEKRYLILYFVSGIGAYLLFSLTNYWEVQHLIADYGLIGEDLEMLQKLKPGQYYPELQDLSLMYSTPMVGASGSLFGVLVAFAMLFPNALLMLIFAPIPMKAKYFIPIFIVIELMMALQNNSGDNVAHFAHLGGALVGFILLKLWKPQVNRWN